MTKSIILKSIKTAFILSLMDYYHIKRLFIWNFMAMGYWSTKKEANFDLCLHCDVIGNRRKSSLPPQNIPFCPQMTTDITFGSPSALFTVSTMPCLTAALCKIQHIFTWWWVYSIYMCRFTFTTLAIIFINTEFWLFNVLLFKLLLSRIKGQTFVLQSFFFLFTYFYGSTLECHHEQFW